MRKNLFRFFKRTNAIRAGLLLLCLGAVCRQIHPTADSNRDRNLQEFCERRRIFHPTKSLTCRRRHVLSLDVAVTANCRLRLQQPNGRKRILAGGILSKFIAFSKYDPDQALGNDTTSHSRLEIHSPCICMSFVKTVGRWPLEGTTSELFHR